MTGFSEWYPQAFMVATQYTSKPGKKSIGPDDVLRWMIAQWVEAPESRRSRDQTPEQQVAQAKALAIRHSRKKREI